VVVAGEPFVGASVGYFAFLALLANRSLTVSLVKLLNVMLIRPTKIPWHKTLLIVK
jgi:hypothetical protein